ncbi:unnamed protein product, partial [Gadus morhua 'NCC']
MVAQDTESLIDPRETSLRLIPTTDLSVEGSREKTHLPHRDAASVAPTAGGGAPPTPTFKGRGLALFPGAASGAGAIAPVLQPASCSSVARAGCYRGDQVKLGLRQGARAMCSHLLMDMTP